MSDYLTEAFQKLRLVEDDFDLSADANKIDELKSFVADDIEVPEEEVIDVEAVSEDDLEDNYNGKVILECECCHSRIYKDKDEVFIDDESNTANIDEECPVCNNTLGYSVIGKIEPYEKAKEIEVNVNDEDEVEPELESLNKTYKGGIKIKEDLEEIKDDELPDDDIEVEEGCSKKKLTEAPWVWQPDEDESEEPDSPMPEDEPEDEDDYEEDGVPFINGKYTPGPLTQEVIDALYESGDWYINEAADDWGLEDVYDAMENSGDPESGMSITIEESPEADGEWYRDDEFVDTGALINTLRRYVLIGLEKKYGQKWKDILDSHPEKSWYMDYNNVPEPTVAKDRQEMIDGAKAVIKAARENGSFEESCKPKEVIKEGIEKTLYGPLSKKAADEFYRYYDECFKEYGEDPDDMLDWIEAVRDILRAGPFEEDGILPDDGCPTLWKELDYGDNTKLANTIDREGKKYLRAKLKDFVKKYSELDESCKSGKGKKINESPSIWNKLVKAYPELNEEAEACPECGKSPCECEKVEEACSKKAKKGSAWDKLKKKNPELKEQKLTEAPWVWKDEDEDNNNSNVEPLEGNIEDLGLSKKAVAEYYDCLDSFVKYFDRECLADFFEDPYDPENSIHDVFDSAKVLRNDIKKKALTAGKEGSKEYWNERNRYWDKVCELGLDYLEKNIELDESCKSRKGKKKINESPWVWKDDDEVEDGEDNNFSQEEINDAVKNAAKMILADPEATEIGEWVKEKAGLPDNIDPILAYCKFESEIDEMPGEGLFGKILHDDDSEFYDYWLNVYDFEERIAEYLGEFGLEKFGHTAWAKCKIRPGAFYDFGESFKESVEVTAKGEDNVNVSKNDDGSMDINVSSTEPGEGEEIVPLEDEEITEIEGNEPEGEEEEEIETEEGEEEAEGGEEETAEEGSEEEVGEFDEEEFDNMGESYMRRVYSNVKSYHTTSVADTGSELIIEGVISFKSGSQKKTAFVLKNLGANKHGKRIFEGYNKTFSNSSKAFRITGGLDKGRYYPRTFRYNYKTKTINESNKSEVFGVKGLIKAENCRKRHGR